MTWWGAGMGGSVGSKLEEVWGGGVTVASCQVGGPTWQSEQPHLEIWAVVVAPGQAHPADVHLACTGKSKQEQQVRG